MFNSTEDFNEQLLLLLCQSKEEENTENNCLISGEPLNDDHVILKCKHKFNYEPLMNELINQKQYSQLEIIHLRQYDIKCPYCRHVQNGVIPYNEKYNIDKISGINWPPSKQYKGNKCCAILKSGKRKGEKCGKSCSGMYCTRHVPKVNQVETPQFSCMCILKSGKRKGEMCGAKCIGTDSIQAKMCKRHLRYKKAKEEKNQLQQNVIVTI